MPQVCDRLIDFGHGIRQPSRDRPVAGQGERGMQVQPGGEQPDGDRLP
jgi:hypothetical protein